MLTRAQIPNALTTARLVLSAGCIAMLAVYRFPEVNAWALPAGLMLFVAAAFTDFLDGHLARKWGVVSVYGRIMDSAADKVLILGTLIMLAGPNFAGPGFPVTGQVRQPLATGLAPWMVVVILAREILITSIRGAFESRGVDFSATLTGKLKMIAQSVGIPAIMLIIIVFAQTTPELRDLTGEALRDGGSADPLAGRSAVHLPDAAYFTNVAISWIITIISAASGVPYVMRAIDASRRPKAEAPPPGAAP